MNLRCTAFSAELVVYVFLHPNLRRLPGLGKVSTALLISVVAGLLYASKDHLTSSVYFGAASLLLLIESTMYREGKNIVVYEDVHKT